MPRQDAFQADSIPAVLAPGLLCDARLWGPVRSLLDGACTLVDFQADRSMEAMAERILRQAPARFILAGFSMGGMAAIVAAARAPERIAGLVIAGAHGETDTDARRQARLDQIGWARTDSFAQMIEARLMPAYFSDGARPPFADLVERMAKAQSAEAFERQVQALIDRPDIAAAARTLALPAIVMTGAEDRLAPPALAQGLARAIDGSRFQTVAGCGHFLPLEQPALLAEAIGAVRAMAVGRAAS